MVFKLEDLDINMVKIIKSIEENLSIKFTISDKRFNPNSCSIYIQKQKPIKISLIGIKELNKDIIKLIQYIDSLEEIYLYFNLLEYIPDFSPLENLKKLCLSRNNIKKISNIDVIHSLKHLELANNQIEEIENFDDSISLKSLFLSKNKIKSIDGLEKLRNLLLLDLSDNDISSIENLDSNTQLRELYLNGNKIKSMENLKYLKNLKELHLDDNFIQNIGGISHLDRLNELHLDGNPLKEKFELYNDHHAQYWVSYSKMEDDTLDILIPILSFIGYSNSGKSGSIESVISYLTEENIKVFAFKHIHKDNFSIDTPGKNTWRFSKAGAEAVVSQSLNESALIFNWVVDPLEIIKALLNIHVAKSRFSENEKVCVIMEGFRTISAKKILCVETLEDIEKQIDPSVIAIAGKISNEPNNFGYIEKRWNLPVYNLLNEPESIVQILKEYFPERFDVLEETRNK